MKENHGPLERSSRRCGGQSCRDGASASRRVIFDVLGGRLSVARKGRLVGKLPKLSHHLSGKVGG
jgi:hypothetical protein